MSTHNRKLQCIYFKTALASMHRQVTLDLPVAVGLCCTNDSAELILFIHGLMGTHLFIHFERCTANDRGNHQHICIGAHLLC